MLRGAATGLRHPPRSIRARNLPRDERHNARRVDSPAIHAVISARFRTMACSGWALAAAGRFRMFDILKYHH
jgi:hypothetical protein